MRTRETIVNISVLGTGNVGGTLGRRWAAKGHQVTFGSRDPLGEKARNLLATSGPNAHLTGIEQAAAEAQVVVLAVPWSAVPDTLPRVGELNGKILIDCINPINASFSGLDLGFVTSAAERIAALAPGARVVKCFNTVSAATIANPSYGDRKATVFYCGDDTAAKQVVHELAEQLDLHAVDSGPRDIWSRWPCCTSTWPCGKAGPRTARFKS
jgi:NADPH-dependent F420 reductase